VTQKLFLQSDQMLVGHDRLDQVRVLDPEEKRLRLRIRGHDLKKRIYKLSCFSSEKSDLQVELVFRKAGFTS
jgi:hypothetical protein